MFIRITELMPPFVFGGCKIRLIFLIIKIMEEYFFGKVIDQEFIRIRDKLSSDILAETACLALDRLIYEQRNK